MQRRRGLGVSVRKGELENEFNQIVALNYLQFGHGEVQQVPLTAVGGRSKKQVTAAKNIARFTEDDPYCGLADSDLMPEQFIDLDLYHPWTLSPDAAQELAIECETAGLDVDSRIVNSDGAQVSSQQGIRVCNSHGFVGGYASTRHSLSCVLIGEDDQGMQRDYWYTVARNAEDLEDALKVGVQCRPVHCCTTSAAQSTYGHSFPILLAPQLASGLIGHLLGAISGGTQYRKATFLLDSVGQQVLPDWLSLQESPLLPRSLGAAYFDGDGVATRDNCFVANGILQSYVLSEYSARKLGLQTTANAGGVQSFAWPSVNPAKLFKEMGTELYICELMGKA